MPLVKLVTIMTATLLLVGCSSYSMQEQPTPTTVKTTTTKTKTKITRGSGYGFEVPYDSKYGSAN